MARATVSGHALRILVEQAEVTRKKVDEVNEQCEVVWYNSIIGDAACLNQRRDWYLALVDRGAENIMLENEDYLEYLFLVSFDFEDFEKGARARYKEQQQHRQALEEHYQERTENRVDCSVVEAEAKVELEPEMTFWQKIRDAFRPIPGMGPGSP